MITQATNVLMYWSRMSKYLRLRDDFLREEHIRDFQPVSVRGHNRQFVYGQLDQGKDVLKQLEVCAAHPEEAAVGINIRER